MSTDSLVGTFDHPLDLSSQIILKECFGVTKPAVFSVSDDVVCFQSGNIVVLLSSSTLEERHLSFEPNHIVTDIAVAQLPANQSSLSHSDSTNALDEAVLEVDTSHIYCLVSSPTPAVHVFGFPSRTLHAVISLPSACTPSALCVSLDARRLYVLSASSNTHECTLLVYSLYSSDNKVTGKLDVGCVELIGLRSVNVQQGSSTQSPSRHSTTSEAAKAVTLTVNPFNRCQLISVISGVCVVWCVGVGVRGISNPAVDYYLVQSSPSSPATLSDQLIITSGLSSAESHALLGVCAHAWTADASVYLATDEGQLFHVNLNMSPTPQAFAHTVPPLTFASSAVNMSLPSVAQPSVPHTVSSTFFSDHEVPVILAAINNVSPTVIAVKVLDHMTVPSPSIAFSPPASDVTVQWSEDESDTVMHRDGVDELHAHLALRTETVADHVKSRRLVSLAVCQRYLLVGVEDDTVLWYSLPSLTHTYTQRLPPSPLSAAAALDGTYTLSNLAKHGPRYHRPSTHTHRRLVSIVFNPTFSAFYTLNASGVFSRVQLVGQPRMLTDAARIVNSGLTYWRQFVTAGSLHMNDHGDNNVSEHANGAAAVKVLQGLGLQLPAYPLYSRDQEEDEEDAEHDDDNDEHLDHEDRVARVQAYLEAHLRLHAEQVLTASIFDIASLGVYPLATDPGLGVYKHVSFRQHTLPLPLPPVGSLASARMDSLYSSLKHIDIDAPVTAATQAFQSAVSVAERARVSSALFLTWSPLTPITIWSYTPRCKLGSFSLTTPTTAVAVSRDAGIVVVGNIFGGVCVLDITHPFDIALLHSRRVCTGPVRCIEFNHDGDMMVVTTKAVSVFVRVEDLTVTGYVSHNDMLRVSHTHTPVSTTEVSAQGDIDEDESDTSVVWPCPASSSDAYKSVVASDAYTRVKSHTHQVLVADLLKTFDIDVMESSSSSDLTCVNAYGCMLLSDMPSANDSDFVRGLLYRGLLHADYDAVSTVCASLAKQTLPSSTTDADPDAGVVEEVACVKFVSSHVDKGMGSERCVWTTDKGRVLSMACPSAAQHHTTDMAKLKLTTPTVAAVLPFAVTCLTHVPYHVSVNVALSASSLPPLVDASKSSNSNFSGSSETHTPPSSLILAAHVDRVLRVYEMSGDGRVILVAQSDQLPALVSSVSFAPFSEAYCSLALCVVGCVDGLIRIISLRPATSPSTDLVSILDANTVAESLLRSVTTITSNNVDTKTMSDAQKLGRIDELSREQALRSADVIVHSKRAMSGFAYGGGWLVNERPTRNLAILHQVLFTAHGQSLFKGSQCASFCSDMRFMITSGADGGVFCWDLSRILTVLLQVISGDVSTSKLTALSNASSRMHNSIRIPAVVKTSLIKGDPWVHTYTTQDNVAVEELPECVEVVAAHGAVNMCERVSVDTLADVEVTDMFAALSTHTGPSQHNSFNAHTRDHGVAVEIGSLNSVHNRTASTSSLLNGNGTPSIDRDLVVQGLEKFRRSLQALSTRNECAPAIEKLALKEFSVDPELTETLHKTGSKMVYEAKLDNRRKAQGAQLSASRLRAQCLDAMEAELKVCTGIVDKHEIASFAIAKTQPAHAKTLAQVSFLRQVEVMEQRYYLQTQVVCTETTDVKRQTELQAFDVVKTLSPSIQFSKGNGLWVPAMLTRFLKYVMLASPASTPDPSRVAEVLGLLGQEPDLPDANTDIDPTIRKATTNSSSGGSSSGGDGGARTTTTTGQKGRHKPTKPTDNKPLVGSIARMFRNAMDRNPTDNVDMSLLVTGDTVTDLNIEPSSSYSSNQAVNAANSTNPQSNSSSSSSSSSNSSSSKKRDDFSLDGSLDQTEREKRRKVADAYTSMPTISGDDDNTSILPTHNLYHPFALISRRQKLTQMVLVQEQVKQLKRAFNEIFAQVVERKKRVIELIAARNKRIQEIEAELDESSVLMVPKVDLRETPSLLLEVKDSDITVPRVLNKKEREALLLKEQEMLARMGKDDAKDRALIQMMRGQLETKAAPIIEAKTTDTPAWMLETPEAQMTEVQISEYKAHLAQLALLKEEQEKQRKSLLAEVVNLKQEVVDLAALFSQQLQHVDKTRVYFARSIAQFDLVSAHIHAHLVKSEQQEVEVSIVSNALNTCLFLRQRAQTSLTALTRSTQALLTSFTAAVNAEADVDRRVKREFTASHANHIDLCLSVFKNRHRPPVFSKRYLYDFSLVKAFLANPSLSTGLIAGVHEHLWMPPLLHDAVTVDPSTIDTTTTPAATTAASPTTITTTTTATTSSNKNKTKAVETPAQQLQRDLVQAAKTHLTHLYPYPPASLCDMGSAAVGSVLVRLGESTSWTMPSNQQCPTDINEQGQEAWEAAMIRKESQRLHENSIQLMGDDLCNKQSQLMALKSVLTSLTQHVFVLTRAKKRLLSQQLWSSINNEVLILSKAALIELGDDSVLAHHDRSLQKVSVVTELNTSLLSEGNDYLVTAMTALKNHALTLRYQWEDHYISLEHQDAVDVTAELQLLRLTKALQSAVVAGGHEQQQEEEVRRMDRRVEFMRHTTGEKLLTKKDQLDKFKHDTNKLRKENAQLEFAVKSLEGCVRDRLQISLIHSEANLQSSSLSNDTPVVDQLLSLSLQQPVTMPSAMHNNNKKQTGVAGLLAGNGKTTEDKKMKNITTRHKLVSLAKLQADELAYLKSELELFRKRTFASFPSLPPSAANSRPMTGSSQPASINTGGGGTLRPLSHTHAVRKTSRPFTSFESSSHTHTNNHSRPFTSNTSGSTVGGVYAGYIRGKTPASIPNKSMTGPLAVTGNNNGSNFNHTDGVQDRLILPNIKRT